MAFYGKYRGRVSDINDPLMIGRIRARVPDVTGDQETGWALPCAPIAGRGMGVFVLPPVDSDVWIEFEHGDPEYPIWCGGFWRSAADVPPILLAPPYKKFIVKSPAGHSILIDDTPGIGGIILETADGAKVSLTAIALEITNGKGGAIAMQGPQVSVNNGALDVI